MRYLRLLPIAIVVGLLPVFVHLAGMPIWVMLVGQVAGGTVLGWLIADASEN